MSMKFQIGDTVIPSTLSIQGSDSSRHYIGMTGAVVDPWTSRGGVKVEFKNQYSGALHDKIAFVYFPGSLRLFWSSDEDGLRQRLSEARKAVSELEAALDRRSAVSRHIIDAYKEICDITAKIPSQAAREEIMSRIGDISTIPLEGESI